MCFAHFTDLRDGQIALCYHRDLASAHPTVSTVPPMRLPIPNPNPNPKTHPNPNPIFNPNPNPFLQENKNDTGILSYIYRLFTAHLLFAGPSGE